MKYFILFLFYYIMDYFKMITNKNIIKIIKKNMLNSFLKSYDKNEIYILIKNRSRCLYFYVESLLYCQIV